MLTKLYAFVALLFLGILAPAHVRAQETAPFVLAHPTTGEPGVWVPTWLQQDFLLDAAELKNCEAVRETQVFELTERALELHETKEASTELQHSIESLKIELTVTRSEAQDAKGSAERRLYLAIGSTAAAVVAVTILLIDAL